MWLKSWLKMYFGIWICFHEPARTRQKVRERNEWPHVKRQIIPSSRIEIAKSEVMKIAKTSIRTKRSILETVGHRCSNLTTRPLCSALIYSDWPKYPPVNSFRDLNIKQEQHFAGGFQGTHFPPYVSFNERWSDTREIRWVKDWR